MAWHDRLERRAIPRASSAKRLAFVYPYYQNAAFFAQQIAHWRTFSGDVLGRLSVIVVDDGSPTPAVLPPDPPLPMRLFRIGVDVPWNWLAARNIGAHHAADGWLLLTDMDHVVPEDTARALIWGQHDPSHIYLFHRQEHTGEAIPPHSASYFLTRDLFWKTGGYDETLSGHYGSDGEFRRRAAQTAPLVLLPEVLIRHEYVADSSTTTYPRKLPKDTSAIQQLLGQRTSTWQPKTLSFPYQEVSC